jgi:UDP-glucose 4-epimerase
VGLYNHNRKADIFIHCAANCKINKIIKNPHEAFENTQGVYEALEYCRRNKIKRFVFFSSTRVLHREKNPYTASKIYGEELCEAYRQCYGIDYIIIRPSTVYGGRDETGRLMSIWIDNARKNKDLVIYGDRKKILSFTYISDFIVGVIYAVFKGRKNRAYNISSKPIKLYKVAKEIIKQTNSKSKIVFKDEEIAQPQRAIVNSWRVRFLGWKPYINIKEGIRKTLKNG